MPVGEVLDLIVGQTGFAVGLIVALFWLRDALKRLDAVTKRLWIVEDQAAKATALATEVLKAK